MIPTGAKLTKTSTTDHRLYASGKVLLVDPNYRDLEYYSSVLLGQVAEVRTCASYSEATLLLDCDKFDLVILSQGSRSFEGRSLPERAIEIDRRMPVLVLTECLDIGCYLEAMQLGAADYVEKPLRADDVARLVQTHLRHRDQMSRAVGAA